MTRRNTKVFLDKVIADDIKPLIPKSGIGLYITDGLKKWFLLIQKVM
jgi:hypothetical protein